MATATQCGVEVLTRGVVPTDVGELVRSRLEPLVGAADPVRRMRDARVKVTRHANPGLARPVIAQLNLAVGERQLRVEAAGRTVRDAIAALCVRAGRRIAGGGTDHAADRMWPAPYPEYLAVPPADRRLLRRKHYVLDSGPADEAVITLEELDYSFHLFVDPATGADAVLGRRGRADYELTRATPAAADTSRTGSGHCGPPRLAPSEAARRVGYLGLPYLFFMDDVTDRGSVLYVRYDGHYGLVTPPVRVLAPRDPLGPVTRQGVRA